VGFRCSLALVCPYWHQRQFANRNRNPIPTSPRCIWRPYVSCAGAPARVVAVRFPRRAAHARAALLGRRSFKSHC
jgi:hypothetical protein